MKLVLLILAVLFAVGASTEFGRHWGRIAQEIVQAQVHQWQLSGDQRSQTSSDVGPKDVYALQGALQTVDGKPYDLSQHQRKGDVLLVVNIASQCGLTQRGYATANALHEKYSAKGFEVLAFPCNQFLEQEPGSNKEILEFATKKKHATFPVLEKVDVNGPQTHPLWGFLKEKLPSALGSNSILWNFTMFLIDRHGVPRYRFAPGPSVEDVEKVLLELLAEERPAPPTATA